MNRWRVGEDRGSKKTDGCPLTPEARTSNPCTWLSWPHGPLFSLLHTCDTFVVYRQLQNLGYAA
jgi:hypothetical protein